MSEPSTTTSSTQVVSPPGAVNTKVDLPKVDWRMRRLFAFVAGISVIALWFYVISKGLNQWPICVGFCFIVFVYVVGATAEECVRIFQASGIIRAAQSAATSISNTVEDITDAIGRVVPQPPAPPVPTTGGRNDLAS